MPRAHVLRRRLRTGADPERLYRRMRFATVHGVFKTSRAPCRQPGPATTLFANNALSACLREDHPNSQKHLVSTLALMCCVCKALHDISSVP